ncbi:MAG: restriction system-associated AAA family ATPase [Sulfuricurvum sp.]|uniref:restriction system-associated AAA family ATPase n=1 Tax=Sulfuricurvum sp. TaxID=2025608 RepID=UPI002736149F|nr:restriction system-associated AAA family ATPase [Sulfuricurvum sp.]MDP2851568.1 restriction system-associated AAA family ATPase [Sulfuricurvum sp.]
MKLLSIKLLGDTSFRSLAQGFEIKFSSKLSEHIQPKCIIGLNGSGKSNLLELLSEIFFYIEEYLMQVEKNTLLEKKDFDFELEYLLPLSKVSFLLQLGFEKIDKYIQVKIRKENSGYPVFSIKRYESNKPYIVQTERLASFLPSKIIGYSSGMNELISNPYLKMNFQYFKDYEESLKNNFTYHFDTSRLFFMSYESNNLIVVANFLLAESKKLKIFHQELKIDSLNSFRIKIRFQDYDNKVILVPDDIGKDIEKLKSCATIYHDQGIGNKREIVMDFYVDAMLKIAFENHFISAFELFKSFYRLDLLNIHLVPKSIRNQILKSSGSLNISQIIPSAPSKKLFDFEYIKLNKENTFEPVLYENLSDGEHQFLQIFGSLSMLNDEGNLFLLDEPETHFNPNWRSKMISIINNLLNEQESTVKNQEIILTTHSPFILSDSKKENIFKFKKENGNVKYESFENSEIKTYGTSISDLLEMFFEKSESIGAMSYEELQEIISNIKTIENYNEAKKKLSKFGDSIEKFDAYNFLNQKKMELE